MNSSMEITTQIGCAINCMYCPQKLLLREYYKEYINGKKRAGVLSFENFKICIDKLPKETRIDFSGMCEPWLNSQCTKMVLYAHKKGHIISIYTTLVGMTVEDYLKIRLIPFENVIIHIPDSENNSHIAITEEYSLLLKKIIEDVKLGIFSVDNFSCHGDVDERIKKIIKTSNLQVHSELHDRAGNVNNKNDISNKVSIGKFICSASGTKLNRNVLLPDGSVTLCCMDYGLKHVLGNLLTQDYNEISNCKEKEKIRLEMRGENNSDILCRKCIVAYKIEKEKKVNFINKIKEKIRKIFL